MSELAGRKVLVVGAGTQASDDPDAPRGNGRAIAVVAGRAGATVACADLDTDAARATVDLVEAEGATAHVFTADVSDSDACAGAVDAAAAQDRRLHTGRRSRSLPTPIPGPQDR